MQRLEMEEIRQREANETALQAIGFPKKRQKTSMGGSSVLSGSSGGGLAGGSSSDAHSGGGLGGLGGASGSGSTAGGGGGGHSFGSYTSKPVCSVFGGFDNDYHNRVIIYTELLIQRDSIFI